MNAPTKHFTVTNGDHIYNCNLVFRNPTKNIEFHFSHQSTIKVNKNTKTQNNLKSKMNQNLFTSFNIPVILGIPLAVLIIIFPTILIIPPKNLINNRLSSIQQWLVQLTLKQIITSHTPKGRT